MTTIIMQGLYGHSQDEFQFLFLRVKYRKGNWVYVSDVENDALKGTSSGRFSIRGVQELVRPGV